MTFKKYAASDHIANQDINLNDGLRWELEDVTHVVYNQNCALFSYCICCCVFPSVLLSSGKTQTLKGPWCGWLSVQLLCVSTVCKQVLSECCCIMVANRPLAQFLLLLLCVCVWIDTALWICWKVYIGGARHTSVPCPSKHSCSCVPTSPASVWTLLPKVPPAKQTMQVNTAAVANISAELG